MGSQRRVATIISSLNVESDQPLLELFPLRISDRRLKHCAHHRRSIGEPMNDRVSLVYG